MLATCAWTRFMHGALCHSIRLSLMNYACIWMNFIQRSCPIRITINDWIARWNYYIDLQLLRPTQSRSVSNPLGMTRKSIFYQLEYWTKLPIQHLLDTMHISKNVCRSLLEHLTKVKNISKERKLNI